MTNILFTDFITFLLQKIGTYVDPQILVKRIENGLKIPGLQNSLVKMMQDYNLQVFYVFLMTRSQTDVLEYFVRNSALYFLNKKNDNRHGFKSIHSVIIFQQIIQLSVSHSLALF